MISEVLRKENEKQRREGRKEGMKEGRKEGRKEGQIEGRKEGILSITKKMLEKNINIKDIQEITGLSQEELQKLVKTNN